MSLRLAWLLLLPLALAAAAAPPGRLRPSPTPKEIPLISVGDLVLRRPRQFHRIEDKRERMIFEADAKDGYCQLALGTKELGQKASFQKEDCKKLAQTLYPYLDRTKGVKWKTVTWMGQPCYRMEFSGVSANVRLLSVQTFTVRGGMLFWAGMNCPFPERGRWLPVYNEWLRSAHLRR